MPCALATSRLARPRPMPTTPPTAADRLSASANEPPISPTPKMTSLPSSGAATSSAPERGTQCGEEAIVFRRQADRNPQVLRQSVVRHRPDDDALAQQHLVDACGIDYVHQQKV